MAQQFNLTAQINLQSPKNVGRVVSDIQRQLKGSGLNTVNIKVKADARSMAQTNKQLQNISRNSKSASKDINTLNRSLQEATRRFSVITLATGTLLSFVTGFKNATKAAVEFERELIKISQVTGKSVQQLQGLTREVTKLSTSLGVSSSDLLGVSRTLSQAGFSAEKTRKALDILAKTSLGATFTSIQDTTEGAIALLRQFGNEARKAGGDIKFLEKSLDAINAVSKRFAVESDDLITVIRRVGGVFSAAGGEVNELIALFTSVRSTTRESAETIATGLRTIFTRIQRPETISQLRELGIVLQDAQGNFVGAYEAVKRLSQGLGTLDPRSAVFSQIVEDLGGFRQIGKVIPLIQQFSTAQQALAVAQGASGSSARDALKAQAGLGVQIQKVKEEFSALIRQFSDSSTFRSVAKGALEIASAMIKVAEAVEPLLPLLTSLFALKLGRSLAPGLASMAGIARGGGGGGRGMSRFARGGMVPGQGNRDTVPAMLTPGEFVIKKSSVKSLGTDTLARMNNNRYTEGDKVSKDRGKLVDVSKGKTVELARKKIGIFKKALLRKAKDRDGNTELDIGGAFLQPEGLLKNLRSDIKGTEILTAAKNAVGASNIDEAKAFTKASKGSGSEFTIPISIKSSSLSEKTSGRFRAGLRGSISKFSDNFASKETPGIGFSKSKFKTGYSSANMEQIEGGIFESFLNGLSNSPFDEKKESANDVFDFRNGLGSASKAFDGLGPNLVSDAKRTFGLDSLASLTKKGGNLILENITGQLAKSLLEKKPSKDKALTAKRQSLSSGDKLSQNRTVRKASGGRAPSDTVPALLTPGEFVFNKGAAQSIGYGNLSKMNQSGVQGFADGGPVGFNVGGQVRAGIQGGDSINRKIEKAAVALDKVGYSSKQINSILPKFSKNLQAGDTNAAALEKAMKDLGLGVKNVTKDKKKESKEILEGIVVRDKEQARINSGTTSGGGMKGVASTGRKVTGVARGAASGAQGAAGSAQSLLFLGAMVGSVVSQMSSLDEATKKAVTQTTMMVSLIGGVTGTLVDVAASFVMMAASGVDVFLGIGEKVAEMGLGTAPLIAAKNAEALASASSGAADIAESVASGASTGADITEAGGSALSTSADTAEAIGSAATTGADIVEAGASAATTGADVVEAGGSALSTSADTAEAIASGASAGLDVVEAGASGIATVADTAEAGASVAVTAALGPLALVGLAVAAALAAVLAVVLIAVGTFAYFATSLYYLSSKAKAEADKFGESAQKFTDEFQKTGQGANSLADSLLRQSEKIAQSDAAFSQLISLIPGLSGVVGDTPPEVAAAGREGARTGSMYGMLGGPAGMLIGAVIGSYMATGKALQEWQKKEAAVRGELITVLRGQLEVERLSIERLNNFNRAMEDIDKIETLTPKDRVTQRLDVEAGLKGGDTGSLDDALNGVKNAQALAAKELKGRGKDFSADKVNRRSLAELQADDGFKKEDKVNAITQGILESALRNLAKVQETAAARTQQTFKTLGEARQQIDATNFSSVDQLRSQVASDPNSVSEENKNYLKAIDSNRAAIASEIAVRQKLAELGVTELNTKAANLQSEADRLSNPKLKAAKQAEATAAQNAADQARASADERAASDAAFVTNNEAAEDAAVAQQRQRIQAEKDAAIAAELLRKTLYEAAVALEAFSARTQGFIDDRLGIEDQAGIAQGKGSKLTATGLQGVTATTDLDQFSADAQGAISGISDPQERAQAQKAIDQQIAAGEALQSIADPSSGLLGQQNADLVKAAENGQLFSGQGGVISGSQDGNNGVQGNVQDILKNMGIDFDLSFLPKEVQEQVLKAIGEAAGKAGGISKQELDGILKPLQENASANKEITDEIVKGNQEYLNAYKSYLNEVKRQYEEEVKFRGAVFQQQEQAIDREIRARNIINQSLGRDAAVQDRSAKEARRVQQAQGNLTAAGVGVAAGDIGGLTGERQRLSALSQQQGTKIRGTTDDKLRTGLAKEQSETLRQLAAVNKELERLADQSGRVDDMFAEMERNAEAIEKERAKREAVTAVVEEFVVGGQDTRKALVEAATGVRKAFASGTLQNQTEEQRSATVGFLDKLGDVELLGGFTGKEIKQELVFRDAIQMGLDPRIAEQLATATTKEQQLIDSNELLAFEINKLSGVMQAAQQGLDPANVAPALVEPQAKARGGLIYRANGGSIFQPKGTDTVPAMLTPGEFVIRKSAVDAIGTDTLAAINSGASYFGKGGIVDKNLPRRDDQAVARLAGSGFSFSGFDSRGDEIWTNRSGSETRRLEGVSNQNKKKISKAQSGASRFDFDEGQQKNMRQMTELKTNVGQRMREGEERSASNRQQTSDARTIARYEAMGDQTAVGRYYRKTGDLKGTLKYEQNQFAAQRQASTQRTKAERKKIQAETEEMTTFVEGSKRERDTDIHGNPMLPAGSGLREKSHQKSIADARSENTTKVGMDIMRYMVKNQTDSIPAEELEKLRYKYGFITDEDFQREYGSFSKIMKDRLKKEHDEKMETALSVANGEDEKAESKKKLDKAFGTAKSVVSGVVSGAKTIYDNMKMNAQNEQRKLEEMGIDSNSYESSLGVDNIKRAEAKQRAKNRRFGDRSGRGTAASRKAARLSGVKSGLSGTTDQQANQARYERLLRTNGPAAAQRFAKSQNFTPSGGAGAGTGSGITQAFKNNPNMMGSPQAMQQFQQFQQYQKFMKYQQQQQFRGGVRFRAAGGGISGGDTVPAMLTPGEFVMSAGAVRQHGVGTMKALNRGQVKGFNKGGMVGGTQYLQDGGSATGGIDLSQISQTFDKITASITKLSTNLESLNERFGYFEMQHTVMVDGQINLPGIDGGAIAQQITDSIGGLVADEVKKALDNPEARP